MSIPLCSHGSCRDRFGNYHKRCKRDGKTCDLEFGKVNKYGQPSCRYHETLTCDECKHQCACMLT